MTPERWQQIKTILYDALEVSPSQRSAFVARVCSDDPGLRQEVESFLILGDTQLRSNISESTPEHIPLSAGTRLGDYEVQSLLGIGGMGEVYRAHDPRLLRDVAIKVLPAAFARDPERLRRFEQEARAAAALNHPNILAIYDLGTTDLGTLYVVSELLEGENLRECLLRGPLSVRKTVELALQIACGLAAAHEKGIVHRDLKPENIFLTRDGRVKILDFGLAKLMRGMTSDASTLPRETASGVVMGTVGYMPPEQVRGSQVDQRSDVFALGAILYEMLSGARAFPGDTAADTMAAIVSRDPAPLNAANPSVPLSLDRVVRRCLEKNANERFHSVRDVAFALDAVSDPALPAANSVPTSRPGTASSRRDRRIVALVAVVLFICGGWLLYRYRVHPPVAGEWEPITNFPDSVTAPALSPDGRMLAFVRNAETFVGAGDVYVKLLPHGEAVQLTHDDEMKTNPAFSPDSSRIAYTVAPGWDTRVVPTLGGQSQPLLPNASGLSWIDDHHHILFSEEKAGIHMAVVTATESRAEERDVYVPSSEDGMAHRSSLSPDHKWVLVASEMVSPSASMGPCRLVPFDGRSSGSIVGPSGPCSHAAWSPDGQWMYFSASIGKGYHLWRQRFPDGAPEQFTSGPTEEEGIAPSPDGRSILTSVGQAVGTIWVQEHGTERLMPFEGHARLVPPEFATRSVFSPDGSKIYFLGSRNPMEPEELWCEDLVSGTAERVLPGTAIANSYDISPDGTQVIFDSLDPLGQPHLWIASLDRHQPPRRLESTMPETFPIYGPGSAVYFQGRVEGRIYVYRRDLSTGDTRRVLDHPIVRLHTISPDGKWIEAEAAVTGDQATRSVYAYGTTGSASKRLCYNLCNLLWTMDGKHVYVIVYGGVSSSSFKTFDIPLRQGEVFPDLPAKGIRSESDLNHLPGASIIPEYVFPGPDHSRYAVSRWSVHRNIYRIPVP